MKKTLLACSVLLALGANVQAKNIYIQTAGVVEDNSKGWEDGVNERVLGG